MTTWDLAVVGAGPAGASAALTAARTGARVVLLERAALPRYKRCGGGLIGVSADAVRATGVDLPALSRDVVGRLTFTRDGRQQFSRSAPPFLPMVLRAELDAALVQQAVDAGAVLREQTTVTAYAQDGDGVTLTTGGGELRARAVVGADGAQGRAAAHVGVVSQQVDLGLEAEVPTPAGSDWDGRVLLDWGPVPGSYGWVFPKGGTLTVGVIGARSAGPALQAYYRAFLARLGLDRTAALHDGGHLTRVRAPGSPLRRGRVLVAGDAAGLLDPWTREGISWALRSGALAGAAAVRDTRGYEHDVAAQLGAEQAAGREALRSGALAGAAAVRDTRAYEHDVAAQLGAEQAAGREALRVFTRNPGAVHLALRVVPGMWDLFVRVVTGATTVETQLRSRRVRALVRVVAPT